MKSRLVMLMSLAIAALSVVLAANNFSYRLTPVPVVHAKLPTKPSSYLGVFEPGKPPGYPAIATFGQAAGRQPNLAGYFSGWAEQFKAAFADTLHAHRITPLIQIDPTDASMAAIAGGAYDQYLRSYATSVRSFGHPVVIGFGEEMNAAWYPWGYRHVLPHVFVAAWRHLVTVFKQEGAENVTWLWTVQADLPGTGPIKDWWPGQGYVDWVGIDGFYYRPSDTFASVFGKTINQVRAFTNTPVLLSETAVGPQAGQFSKILNLFQGARKARTLGLVWFDIAQNDGINHQNCRIEASQNAGPAFRLGVLYLTGMDG